MPSRPNALQRAKARIATQQQTIEALEQRIRTLEAATAQAQRPQQRQIQHRQEQGQRQPPLLAQLSLSVQAEGRGPIMTRLNTIAFILGAIFRLWVFLVLSAIRFAPGFEGHTVRERVLVVLRFMTGSARKVCSLLVQIGWGVIGAVLWWVVNEVLEIPDTEDEDEGGQQGRERRALGRGHQ